MYRKDPKQEVDMIVFGNHEEIMAYMHRYDFSDTAKAALVERGNPKELKAMKTHK